MQLCWYNYMPLSSPVIKETGVSNAVLTAVGLLIKKQAQDIGLCNLYAHTC
jgi:hypothetical protein